MSESFPGYTLKARLAHGAMAEVWTAVAQSSGKLVAIKRIRPHLASDPDIVSMFAGEAEIASQLHHPNIVEVVEFGEAGGSVFMVMDLVDGPDLGTILTSVRRAGTTLSLGIAILIARRIAAALHYAQRSLPGFVHRDVSPGNILISRKGEIKLCDFGIARAAGVASQELGGELRGKLHYMSPEQASGGAVDARSDVFSLGAVFFEMVTGRKPYERGEELLIDVVRSGRVDLPSSVNAALAPSVDAIVGAALAARPDDRCASAGELEEALGRMADENDLNRSPEELAGWIAAMLANPPDHAAAIAE
ncbi:MAG TPA: serine/threonine-protein kinase [Thermoanaerobaculia bacterium]|nr:serine/threonine-protein kinase [Thermoanaerobaculia bacterium]